MKSPERLLISSVLRSGLEQQSEYVRIGLPDTYFRDHKREAVWMLAFYKKFGRMPSLETFVRQFPDFVPVRTKEPTGYYAKLLCDREDYTAMAGFHANLGKALKEPSFAGIEEARKLVRLQNERAKYSNYDTTFRDYNEAGEDTIDRYMALVADLKNADKSGAVSHRVLPPYKSITKHGIFPGHDAGDFVVLIGRLKLGKTWYTLVWAIHAALCGFPTLIMSKEMSIQQLEDRIDAILFDLDYKAMCEGKLPTKEIKRWRREKKDFKFPAKLILCDDESDDEDHPRGIQIVSDLIHEHKTYFNCVDSAHLYFGLNKGISMTQEAYQMSRKCKRIARQTKTIMFISTQASREGNNPKQKGDYVSAQWADAFEQDASVTMELEGDRAKPFRTLRFRRTRNGAGGDLNVHFQMTPAVNLKEYRQMNTIMGASPEIKIGDE